MFRFAPGHGFNIQAYNRDAGTGDHIMPIGRSAVWRKFVDLIIDFVLATLNGVPLGPAEPIPRHTRGRSDPVQPQDI